VLIVDFASLVFQTFTENEYNTQTKKTEIQNTGIADIIDISDIVR